jgi:hypothetical protein
MAGSGRNPRVKMTSSSGDDVGRGKFGSPEENAVEPLDVIEPRLRQWSVPSDVRDALRRAVAVVGGEGVTLVGQASDDRVSVGVRGQPVAVYLSPSRLSAGLEPEDAQRAHRADSAIGLEKDSETTWMVHCRYGRLDTSRLNSMTALMIKALRRFAPRPEAGRKPRRTASTAAKAGPDRRSPGVASQEERRRAADAAIPRCPVPGCNLPMVGGSCGFHD